MAKLLSIIGVWIISSVIVRFFTALGIAFFTYSGLEYAIEQAIGYAEGALSALPTAILQLLALAGTPEALSIICTAILTRAAIDSIRLVVGLR